MRHPGGAGFYQNYGLFAALDPALIGDPTAKKWTLGGLVSADDRSVPKLSSAVT